MVGHANEQIGRGDVGHATTKFDEFINEVKLVDLLFIGSKFIWSNNREESTFSKALSFFITSYLLDREENLIQKCLLISISEHNSICLKVKYGELGAKTFKFFNYWLEEKKFKTMVEEY